MFNKNSKILVVGTSEFKNLKIIRFRHPSEAEKFVESIPITQF